MAMVAIAGHHHAMLTVTNGKVWTLLDAFDEADLNGVDAVHISVRAGSALNYWYAADGPTVTTSTGHFIPVLGERVIKGIRNVRHLTLISSGSQSVCAITVGGFGP